MGNIFGDCVYMKMLKILKLDQSQIDYYLNLETSVNYNDDDVMVCTVASEQEVLDTKWSLHVLPPGFHPSSKNIHLRLIGVSKLTPGVRVRVHGCLSLCGPVMDW